MINAFLILLCTSQWPGSIPSFSLEFDEQEWEYTCENYWEDIYVPAELTYDYVHYQCQFRIRGAKSRQYPKKSIKVELLEKIAQLSLTNEWEFCDTVLCEVENSEIIVKLLNSEIQVIGKDNENMDKMESLNA